MSRLRRLRRAIRHCSEGLDVNGSAIALGHWRGASRAKLLTTLVHALHARHGLQMMWGGGLTNVTFVERVWPRSLLPHGSHRLVAAAPTLIDLLGEAATYGPRKRPSLGHWFARRPPKLHLAYLGKRKGRYLRRRTLPRQRHEGEFPSGRQVSPWIH
ncbi:hypothetical protein FBR04_13775 [Betaproteobacteria bacterium PRO7]|nr:hypothetical protein [Betaproteobacteria bacterium PRO7]